MIEFNGKKYAKNNDEFIDSLFHAGGTCNGFYKKTKRGIYLYDAQNVLQAFVRTITEPMVMSCTLRENGKKWYSYTMNKTEQWLGIRDFNDERCISFSDERKAIENINAA